MQTNAFGHALSIARCIGILVNAGHCVWLCCPFWSMMPKDAGCRGILVGILVNADLCLDTMPKDAG